MRALQRLAKLIEIERAAAAYAKLCRRRLTAAERREASQR